MRKRILSLLIVLPLAFCVLSGAAFAYGFTDLPQPDSYYDPSFDASWSVAPSYGGGSIVSGGVSSPVIYKEPSAVSACRGDIPDALRVEATSYDGGFIGYQWYMSYSGSSGDMFPITGANGAAYTPEQTLGTVWYCAGVYNVVGSARSPEVFTSLVPVTYSGIQIVNTPSKTSYAYGSQIDLTGLNVRVYDTNGLVWDCANGVGLSVYPTVLNSAGNVAVQVSYGGSSDVFYVNVAQPTAAKTTKTVVDANGNTVEVEVTAPTGPHEHEFSEWEITKPATCVTTGLKTRTCECGEFETEEIERTEHVWDEGISPRNPPPLPTEHVFTPAPSARQTGARSSVPVRLLRSIMKAST